MSLVPVPTRALARAGARTWGTKDRISLFNRLYGWKDNFANLTEAAKGAGSPSMQPFGPSGTIQQRRFGIGDSVYVVWHINHDVSIGSDCFIHVHWTTDGTNTGLVAWDITYTVAAGHNQEPFGTDTTISIEEVGSGTAWQHMITEDDTGFTIPEVDSLIVAEIKRVSPSTGSNSDDVFGIFADLHYLSDRETTPRRAPDFYAGPVQY